MIACTSVGNRANRSWLANRLGDLTIRRRLSVGYCLDLFPDDPLEGSGLNVDGQISGKFSALEIFHEFLSPLLHLLVVPAKVCRVIVLFQTRFDGIVGSGDANCAQSFAGCSQK